MIAAAIDQSAAGLGFTPPAVVYAVVGLLCLAALYVLLGTRRRL